MTRFLQSLLTLTILVQFMSIIQLGISLYDMNRMPADFSPDRIRMLKDSVLQSGASMQLQVRQEVPTKPFALGRMISYDSEKGEVHRSPYLILRHTVPPVREGDERYIMNARGDKMRVEFDDQKQATGISITEPAFRGILVTGIIVYILVAIAIVWFSWQLYQFARYAGKRDFFVAENRVRLRRIGWFTLFASLASVCWPFASPWIIGKLTGFDQWIVTENAPLFESFGLIAGLLLLVIAEAFRKGNQLQIEQEFTI